MTLSKPLACLALATLLAPVAAHAAPAPATGVVTINANVAPRCEGGTLDGASSTFEMGILIDTSSGLLLNDLSAPPKTLVGAFCNTKSSISIIATPMQAQSFTGAPPVGFTDAIDYTASASGWTPTAATFTTDAASNPAALQTRDAAFTGDITVEVSNFTPVGGVALRPVADPNYLGTVIVTLAAVS